MNQGPAFLGESSPLKRDKRGIEEERNGGFKEKMEGAKTLDFGGENPRD